MATTHQYLTYYINLTDSAAVAALQAAHMGGGSSDGLGAILEAPDIAAVTYGSPKLGPHDIFVSPSITSEWFGTENQFPTDVATFDRKSGGWFGWSALFGDTTHYHWRGVFTYAPLQTAGGVGASYYLSLRRWIDGFELPANGEGGTGTLATEASSRGASRHPDGYGLGIRNSAAGTVRTHTTVEATGGLDPQKTWERYYLRPRVFPGADTLFWRAQTAGLEGVSLYLTPAGRIVVTFVDNVGTATVMGQTAALELEAWVRVDLWLWFGQSAFPNVQMWINGDVVLSLTDAAHGIAAGGKRHQLSTLGTSTVNTMALDVDDWMCADQPATTTALDFQNGSRMVLVSATSLHASTTNWTGEYRTALQNPVVGGSNSFATALAPSRLALVTDAERMLDDLPESIGVAAITVGKYGTNGNLAGDTVGFDCVLVPQGATVVAGAVAAGWVNGGFWRGPVNSEIAIKPVGPLTIVHTKALAGAASVQAIAAVAEVIGCFGPEDVAHLSPTPDPLPVHLGPHNAPYPRTPWARLTVPPIQPVFIRAGTYVGNDVGQDLSFPAPVHFLWIRPLAGDTGGVRWWSTLLGAHHSLDEQLAAGLMPQACADPNYVPGPEDTQQAAYLVRLAGNNAQNNALGVTYAFIAVGDPGMRFLQNAVLKQHKGVTTMTTTLMHPAFTPQAGFFYQEIINGGAVARHYYKGPGHAAASLSLLNNAEMANALTFGLASLVSQSAFHMTATTSPQIAASLWRQDDTSGNAGKVVQAFSYVGNAAGTRAIPFPIPVGVRPLWALIVPHNGAAIMRDPSHLGTTSTLLPAAANAATGIISGAIDSLTVGIALNANLIVYDVFVILGGVASCNNGWGCPGDYVPVSPEPPSDAPTIEDGPVPGDEPVADPTGTDPTGTGTGDFSSVCVLYSTKLINIALSNIGISQPIVDINTDATPAATLARLHYSEAMEATLRAFPWPFATKYALLTVVGGTADVEVNGDWQYSYREPTDSLFARRIVPGAGEKRNWDPNPVKFRRGVDITGGLIYTDETPATLEYTFRPTCPARSGDAMFRQAFAWRLGSALAPGLSRDDKRMAFCLQMFNTTIKTAERAAAAEGQQDNGGDAAWITARD